MARRMVKAPQRGHLNSMTLACPLARSLPHWQHLISSRTSFRIVVKSVAPPGKSVYRAFCLARDDTDRRILCMRGLVLMWGRGGLVRPVGGGAISPPPLSEAYYTGTRRSLPEAARPMHIIFPVPVPALPRQPSEAVST